MLYVPHSEINDATYNVSDDDKRLNQTQEAMEYSNDENITMTTSPASPTDRIQVEFTSFDVEDYAL